MRPERLVICCAYPGCRESMRLSIMGTLIPANSAVTARGPATVHHAEGCAAMPKSQIPHQ